MSFPENILDKFNSSSYFHIIAICDSNETADLLTSSNIFSQHIAQDPSKPLTPQKTSNGGSYVIVIDGSTDASYVVQEASWSTIITRNMYSRQGPYTSSAAIVQGHLIINEPLGVRFLDYLAKVCDALDSDPFGLVWVMKTYFIGHINEPNGPSQQLISDIRPFRFVPIDIQASFSEVGGTYSFEIVGGVNGLPNLPYANDMLTSITVSNTTLDLPGVSKVTTLQDIFSKTLPAILDQQYSSYTNLVQQNAQQVGYPFNVKNFRPVKYIFNLDPEYQSSKYIFGDNEQDFKQDVAGTYILSFSERPTVDEIIQKIMLSSKAVVQEANSETEKYVFSVHSAVTSTPSEYQLTYYINRYQQTYQNTNTPLPTDFPPANNYIEFDYIYTGKNIDILEYDMKMQMGLAFFANLRTTQNIPDQQDYIQGLQNYGARSSTGGASSSQQQTSTAIRTKTPLLGGRINWNTTLRNKKLPVSTTNFMSALSRQAAIENIQSKVTIRGNPQLLSELNASPADMANRKVTTNATQGIGTYWMKIPIYVKINIMTPSNGDTLNYAEKFWYNGWYQVWAVKNIFESDGSFKQELDMFSLMYADQFDKLTDPSLTSTKGTVSTTAATSTSSTNGQSRTIAQAQQSRNKNKSNG